jgi:NAD-reducing hydrogenase large subunit
VPGGVRTPLSEEAKAWILDRLPEAKATVKLALDLYKTLLDGPLQREQSTSGISPACSWAGGARRPLGVHRRHDPLPRQ